MMDKTLEILTEKYRERMAVLQDAIARGNCATFEDYKYACGQLRGLEAACMVIEDLTTTMENSDE